jgi:Asp-tRNA(Asn)/Glu-tRNA(Gln) amidotransferase C subunit
MKKSSKIRSFKALVLGQLLLGSLCVSAHADWDWTTIGELKRLLGELSLSDTAKKLEDIVQWTTAANRITVEIARIVSDPETVKEIDQIGNEIRNKAWQIEQNTKGVLSRMRKDPQSAGLLAEDIRRDAQAAQDNFRAALMFHHSTQKAFENRRPNGTGCYW